MVASKHSTFELAEESSDGKVETGSIPAAYDRYLGSMLFQPYAEDLAARLQVAKNGSVLELACGTGILTRALRTGLPSTVKLTATDLNEPMFRHAAAKFRKDEAVQWMQADACSLPFGDRMFDAVVCQPVRNHVRARQGAGHARSSPTF